MSEDLNPKTFDLIGALSGRDYPTLDVEIYINEALGFEIYQIEKELKAAELRGLQDEIIEIDARLLDRINQTKSEKYVIGLKAIPEKVRRTLIAKNQKDYPDSIDAFGRTTAHPEADAQFTLQMWGAYIRTVTSPDGTIKLADENDIEALYDNAPLQAQQIISNGIKELQLGSAAGYEQAAKEVDFLSHASPEG